MQKTMLEEVNKNENIILISPTGSGKTLAFLLPLVSLLSEEKKFV
ncbi:MAG: DEAD/DEAH box helicase, partial [Bacteroidia bacterium]